MTETTKRLRTSQKYRRRRTVARLVLGLIFSLVLAANITVGVELANDEPNDGKLYQSLAVNLVERGVFSSDSEPPFAPTLIRLPGYPLFLAGIYTFAGVGNNTYVRIVQSILYFGAAGLAGLTAFYWVEDARRPKRKAAWATALLVGLCPFAAIYSATILTESLTIFVLSAMTVTATCGLKAASSKSSFAWWLVSGIIAGIGVLLRPDSGLFALGLGLTLVAAIFLHRPDPGKLSRRILISGGKGIVFTSAFAAVLIPWTMRNEREFGVFQPLAPAHAEAPGEFVPLGYFHWVRTWIDDERYIEPILWNLEDKPIPIEAVPARAFNSDEERTRVAELLDAYNHSDPDYDQSDSTAPSDEDSGDDTGDETDKTDTPDDRAEDESYDLKITPEVDAEFEKIAAERVAARPIRYYVELPAERAAAMWFDTHSAYYSFSGELFPLRELDGETGQNIWLPIFAVLTWLYTLLALGGVLILAAGRRSLLWLFMAASLCVPRIVFFSTLENPEPRYFVELFLIAGILGGVFISRFRLRRSRRVFSLEFAMPGKR